MSACSCSYGSEILGARITGPHTARKPGFTCGCCAVVVSPGVKCVDIAGLYADEYGGFFLRMHDVCWELVWRFKQWVCGFSHGEWVGAEDLMEMADGVMAQGDEEWARDWLILYEKTWAWTALPEKEERAETCADCIRFAWCTKNIGVTEFQVIWEKPPCPKGYWFEKVKGIGDNDD